MQGSPFFAALPSPLTGCGYPIASRMLILKQFKPASTGKMHVSFLTKLSLIPSILDFTIPLEKDFQAAKAGCRF